MSLFTVHFKGPLMALQGPRIDGEPQSLPIPTRSMVTGLFGAALGLSRAETQALQGIQDTLSLAVVVHDGGLELIDYQIADLSKLHMQGPMWSSGRTTVKREGSQVTGLRQQWRPYLADAHMTLVIQLLEKAPYSAEEILHALDHPARPLFLGRTTCPPETRLAGAVLDDPSLEDACERIAREKDADFYVPALSTTPRWGDVPVPVPGQRDWVMSKHSGSDMYFHRASTLPTDAE